MRYIGNKENIINKIYNILQSNNVVGESFFDFFSGTTNVARLFTITTLPKEPKI